MKRKIEIEVDVPEDGYDVLGWRRPLKGQRFIDVTGQMVLIADRDYSEPRWVLRKVEPVKYSTWVNHYSHGFGGKAYRTLEEANGGQKEFRLAVLRIDYEDGRPVRYTRETLDPAPPLTQ